MGRRGQDIALKQFLGLLVWLRHVLLQDAAVLFAQHPNCALFQFPLFQSTQFRDFSASSTAIIAHAEEDARTNIQNLPGHYARAIQGFMVSVRLTQEAAQKEHHRRMDIIQEQVTRVEGMLGVIAMTKGSRRGKKGKEVQVSVLLSLHYAENFGVSTVDAATLPPGPPPALVPAVVPGKSCPPLAAKALPTSTTAISAPAMQPPATPPTPMAAHLGPAPITACSGLLDEQHHQQLWDELTTRFKEERLRRHTWEWVSGGLLPFYTFQPVSRITDIWEEHANGLNGYMAVRDLDEHWGARWRRNRDGQRTENCRRKKVVHLIERLALKTNWGVKLALRFVREKYEANGTTPRAFCTYLQKNSGAGIEEVMAMSNSFP